MNYYQKYLKYKEKYLLLKNKFLEGGASNNETSELLDDKMLQFPSISFSDIVTKINERKDIKKILFVDIENTGEFLLEVATGSARHLPINTYLNNDIFVWILVPLDYKTRIYASRPTRSLFDEGRIAYSACDTKDSTGKAIFDALDSFVASGVELLARNLQSTIDFYIITGDRAKGPMKSVIESLEDSRVIKRYNRSIFSYSKIIIDPETQVQEKNDTFDIFFSTNKSDKPIQKLQTGLDELWEELKKKDDIIEGPELKRSPQRFKKICNKEFKYKSISFSVSV